MRRVTMLGVGLALAMLCGAGAAAAKGLDELSQSNPESSDKGSDKSGDEDGDSDSNKAAERATQPQSATSKALADKLFLASTLGRVLASKSSGDWSGDGMSDITVGYKLPLAMGTRSGLFGTYRYAPVEVHGAEDGQSYRGVWDTHYLGGRFNWGLGSSLTANGTFELGYVLAYMGSADGLPVNEKHEANGVVVALGGGIEWALWEKIAAGPKLVAAFGSVTTIQISGGASFLF